MTGNENSRPKIPGFLFSNLGQKIAGFLVFHDYISSEKESSRAESSRFFSCREKIARAEYSKYPPMFRTEFCRIKFYERESKLHEYKSRIESRLILRPLPRIRGQFRGCEMLSVEYWVCVSNLTSIRRWVSNENYGLAANSAKRHTYNN